MLLEFSILFLSLQASIQQLNREYHCQPCPEGKFFLHPCTQDGGKPVCSVCPKGTFMDKENNATSCFDCKFCMLGQIQRSVCTFTRDTVCECPEGEFWFAYTDFEGICLEHSVCKEGQVVGVEGTPTTDTICVPATHGRLMDILFKSGNRTLVNLSGNKDARTKDKGQKAIESTDGSQNQSAGAQKGIRNHKNHGQIKIIHRVWTKNTSTIAEDVSDDVNETKMVNFTVGKENLPKELMNNTSESKEILESSTNHPLNVTKDTVKRNGGRNRNKFRKKHSRKNSKGTRQRKRRRGRNCRRFDKKTQRKKRQRCIRYRKLRKIKRNRKNLPKKRLRKV